MTNRTHLLPRNATPIEQAISLAIDPFDRLAAPIEYLSRVKIDAPDVILPWLIWEYDLGELLPYLHDPRQAIREGLRWQRLRGTPAALAMALSWIGMTAAIEEEEPTPAHWAEFQLDPGRVLLDAEIDPILAVARLSAPARSRLARIYHGYDRRHLRLDRSQLDDALLSDYSGSVWTDGVTRLSFGRRFDAAVGVDPDVWMVRLATHLFYAHYADHCRLDVMALSGCLPLPNPRFEHGHLYELVQRNALNERSPIAPVRKYCKAQVVPSEQWALGDTNACLPAREWVPGDPFLLGNGLLSQVTGGRWREILERFERISRAETLGHEVVWYSTTSHWRGSDVFARRVLRLGDGQLDECGFLDIFGAELTSTITGRYIGQRWAGPWAGVAWSTANTLITTQHTEES
jgi:hypothetical protein